MAWRTVSRRRRVFSRVVVIVLCLGLLWSQTLPASFAFFQHGHGGGPQPQRRWRWPGRKPNLNAERHAPAHVPVQHAPNILRARSPKAPRGPRRSGLGFIVVLQLFGVD
jgi:hypothetical protein